MRKSSDPSVDEYKEQFELALRALVVIAHSPAGLLFMPWGLLVVLCGPASLYYSREIRWYLSHSRVAYVWFCVAYIGSATYALAHLHFGARSGTGVWLGVISVLSLLVIVVRTFSGAAQSYADARHSEDIEQRRHYERKEPYLG